MIVIDASALAKYLLREEGWKDIEEYLMKKVYSLDFVVKEVANAIWKHVVIRRIIPENMGKTIYKQLKRLVEEGVIVLEKQDKYIDEALELALKHHITIYDALYITQATRHGELLTSDKKQADTAKKLNITTYYIK